MRQVLNTRRPPLRNLRTDRPVKSRVDFDEIDVSGEETYRVEACGTGYGIKQTLPIRIISARNADPDFGRSLHAPVQCEDRTRNLLRLTRRHAQASTLQVD